jgi:hypothetical protein
MASRLSFPDDRVLEALKKNKGHPLSDDYLYVTLGLNYKDIRAALTRLKEQNEVILLDDGCWQPAPSPHLPVKAPNAPHPKDNKTFDFADHKRLKKNVLATLRNCYRDSFSAARLANGFDTDIVVMTRILCALEKRNHAERVKKTDGLIEWKYVDRSIWSEEEEEEEEEEPQEQKREVARPSPSPPSNAELFEMIQRIEARLEQRATDDLAAMKKKKDKDPLSTDRQ